MKIISDKELRVTTLAGAVIVFQAGDPITVSDEIGLLALQAGAKVHTTKNIEEPTAEVAEFEEVEEVEEVDNAEEVVVALRMLIEEADPNSFKNDGTPKAQTVSKLVGRTVRTEEREAAWEIALNT